MFYVIHFSQVCCLSQSFFPNFGEEPFPKIAGKSPAGSTLFFINTMNLIVLIMKLHQWTCWKFENSVFAYMSIHVHLLCCIRYDRYDEPYLKLLGSN